MTMLFQQVAELSPVKKKLLGVLLRQQDIDITQLPFDEPVAGDEGGFALSSVQESMFYLNQLAPDSAAYNVPRAIRLRGELHIRCLEQALALIVDRHRVLSVRCEARGEAVLQVPAADTAIELSLSIAASFEEALQRATDSARMAFDLIRGPLWRFELIRIAADDHLLVLVFHHIVTDGFSDALLAQELSGFYSDLVSGRQPAPEPLPAQYRDYVLWERMRLDCGLLDEQLNYWVSRLKEMPPLLELPLDHPRLRIESFRGKTLHFRLDESLSASARACAMQHRVTLFTLLLSVLQVLFYRYSKQQRFLIATPVTTRNRREFETLIGCFANSVVIDADFSDRPGFEQLLARTAENAVSAFSNQDLPFERLVSELHTTRDLSHNPVFQAAFALHQGAFGDHLEFQGLEASAVELDKGAAMYDIDVAMVLSAEGIRAAVEYNADIFDDDTIERMFSHYRRLLAAFIAEPGLGVGEVALLDEREYRTLVSDWNDTATEIPADRPSLHRLFEIQASRTPDAVAVEGHDESLTYAELEQQANRLAHYLCSTGIGPGALVGIALERTPAMPMAALAVLKAGAAYVPLDPSYPGERLGFMIDDAGLAAVVTSGALAAGLPLGQVAPVCLEQLDLSAFPDTPPTVPFAPEDRAYVIYTSGSTGKPKGVQVPHRAVVNFLYGMAREPGITERDTLVAVTTLSFDIAVLELYLPLVNGARVVLADRETAADGAALRQLLEAREVSMMQATPATWRLLLGSGWSGGRHFKALCGGEALPADMVQPLLARVGELWNMYGPTETTVWSTCHRVTDAQTPACIGRPIANTRVYVLDEHMNPVPVNVPGELYIGGQGVTLGYLNRPELTAGRFVADPFSDQPQARLYRTGDGVRWTRDGRLEYLQRLDTQVKVRGFRIEPGEIETLLQAHPRLAQSVVVVREDRPGDVRLVAYVIAKPGEVFTITEIRDYLRRFLPDYMIPQHLVELEDFPLTPNGKVDRKALPAPFAIDTGNQGGQVEPRTPAERYLLDVWKAHLGNPRIRTSDNFFEIGGHSLLSMQVIARIHEDTGSRINPREMVLNTLAGIARRIEQPPLVAAERDTPGTPPAGPREAPMPAASFTRKVFDLFKLGRH